MAISIKFEEPTEALMRSKHALVYLTGWKEIANYMRMGVRTVQRYERDLHLPIRRPSGKGAVIAIRTELDEWATAAPMQVNLEPKIRTAFNKTNSVGADFLRIDSEIALTFSSIAFGASDGEKKRRTTLTARTAYNSITRLRKNIRLDNIQNKTLDANLDRLKSELQRLGQSF